MPGWGLIEPPREEDAATDPVAESTDALTRAMWLVAVVLAAASAVHVVRYVIAVINRSRPIPVWIDWLSSIAVLVFGLMALVGVVVATVSFGRWVREIRTRSFESAGFTDPRRRIVVLALSVIPLVNVIGAPWLLHEAAVVDRIGDGGRRFRVGIRLAAAWAIVNAVALLAFAYRIAAWTTDSLQTDADALALVAGSLAVSALFAWWAVPRVERLAGFAEDTDISEPRRLVAA